MAKRYARLNWQNKPSVATPINATNLNKMDKGIDDIDTALNNLENSIVGQIVNDPTKINNAAVNYSLANQISELNKNSFKYIGMLNAESDWNALINAGYYKVSGFGPNTPDGNIVFNYGTLILFVAPDSKTYIYTPEKKNVQQSKIAFKSLIGGADVDGWKYIAYTTS